MSDPDNSAEFASGSDDTWRSSEPGIAPLLAELRQLLDDGKTLGTAELNFQKTRALVVASGVRKLALRALFAVVFVIFALGALTIGLLLVLTPLVTAWGATAIVVGGLLVGAGLCIAGVLAAWRRIGRAFNGEMRQ